MAQLEVVWYSAKEIVVQEWTSTDLDNSLMVSQVRLGAKKISMGLRSVMKSPESSLESETSARRTLVLGRQFGCPCILIIASHNPGRCFWPGPSTHLPVFHPNPP